jgi:hypothetical protein
MTRRKVSWITAGILLAGAALCGASFAADAAKAPSSCVACHTDVERLKAETATIKVPGGSALQAGKG